MMTILGWLLFFVLVAVAALLLSPVRYRCEANGNGGFLEISFFFGLYKKRICWPENEEEIEIADIPVEELPLPVDMGREEAVQPKAEAEKRAPDIDAKEPSLGEEMDHPKGEPPASLLATKADLGEEAKTQKKGKPSRLDLLLQAWDNGTIHLLLDFIRKLIDHGKPGYFRITGEAGLGDPMDTGVAAGLTCALLPGVCHIQWNYTEKILDLSLKARGRLVPAYIFYLGGQFLSEKPVREMIKQLRMKNQE